MSICSVLRPIIINRKCSFKLNHSSHNYCYSLLNAVTMNNNTQYTNDGPSVNGPSVNGHVNYHTYALNHPLTYDTRFNQNPFNGYVQSHYQWNSLGFIPHHYYYGSGHNTQMPFARHENGQFTNDSLESVTAFGSEYANHYQYSLYNHTKINEKEKTHLSEEEIREMIENFRRWKLTHFSRVNQNHTSHNGTEFTLMTYNILAQNLLENHINLYENCDESSLKWPQRGERILKELIESSADIMCLQEVHEEHFNDLFVPALKSHGYDMKYKKKTGDKCDGCAIIYKPSKFQVESFIELELMREDISRLLNRDNVALIGVFKPIGYDTKLIVATTHLLFTPKRGDVKVAQLRLLLAEIDRVALKGIENNKMIYYPIILCGDMNSEPNSSIYRFIRDGFGQFHGQRCGDISGQHDGYGRGNYIRECDMKLNGLSDDSRYDTNRDYGIDQSNRDYGIDQSNRNKTNRQISHNFNFSSVYPYYDYERNRFVSTFHSKACSLVDYIFYSQSENLRLHSYVKLLNSKQMSGIGCLPNQCLGSDHLSLTAKFLLNS